MGVGVGWAGCTQLLAVAVLLLYQVVTAVVYAIELASAYTVPGRIFFFLSSTTHGHACIYAYKVFEREPTLTAATLFGESFIACYDGVKGWCGMPGTGEDQTEGSKSDVLR